MYPYYQLPTHNESRKRITGYDKLDKLTYIVVGFVSGIFLIVLVFVLGGYLSGFLYSMSSQMNSAVSDMNRTRSFNQKLLEIHHQAAQKTNETKQCLK